MSILFKPFNYAFGNNSKQINPTEMNAAHTTAHIAWHHSSVIHRKYAISKQKIKSVGRFRQGC